jgi:hypothetical protein
MEITEILSVNAGILGDWQAFKKEKQYAKQIRLFLT